MYHLLDSLSCSKPPGEDTAGVRQRLVFERSPLQTEAIVLLNLIIELAATMLTKIVLAPDAGHLELHTMFGVKLFPSVPIETLESEFCAGGVC